MTSITREYYTRSVFGPAWSPDGQQIVFTSDMSGRANLWKVRASGGWPIQLTQSDDRQFNPVWSPDGKWIAYQQDRAGRTEHSLTITCRQVAQAHFSNLATDRC